MSAHETGPAAATGRARVGVGAVLASHARPADRPSLVARGKAAFIWWKHTRPGRAGARFRARNGGVLSGGIAYAALFSVFAALTISYTAFIAILGDNEELRERVLVALDTSYPYLLDTGDGQGLLDPASLELSSSLTLAGVVAVVVLLLSAVAAMTALRRAVRAMFATELGGNVMIGKARDLGGFVGMVFAVLLSAVLTTVVATVASWILDVLGWDGLTPVVLRALGILVAFVIDVAFFLLVVKVLAGENPPRSDLFRGAVIAAAGLAVVRMLGTTVVAASVSKNPLFTSVAVLVTLLVWVNLIARIVLLAAAWTADPPYVEPLGAPQASTG
ncbi:YihY/virulence factor BrkB family protein [Cellulomonas sp. Leaf395]|uniref:YihY/virulence factor BrkB family protein n=1 Tax=Cellulomonas sp. Leaf395 TaxID=1736362 RepID=UPI0006F7C9DB|nr:YhjD/YihY/BrkB family envelope integrity protein [Cellulomonas sp. Leaf395]KQT02436.1 ribonuclease BN [Cellulomonas sp. Leaf395]